MAWGRVARGRATHNAVRGATVHGPVIQAGTITGSVHIGLPPPPRPKAVLDDAADRLADSLRKRWRSEEQRWRVQDPVPLAGRLPWSVGAFLDDAHRRGVLRQAGAVYQFRHARLQDRLSGRAQEAEAKACSRRGM